MCRLKYYIEELINMNITNNIHIHIPDTDKHGNFYTTTEDGSMTPGFNDPLKLYKQSSNSKRRVLADWETSSSTIH